MEPKNNTARRQIIEYLMIFFGIVGPFATIPTILKIWHTHTHLVSGQSIITWSAYAVISSAWVIYGIYFKRVAIWAANLLYLVAYFAVITGILHHSGLTW